MDLTESNAARSSMLRSKVTNGTKIAASVDGRSADARRYRDLVISYADDLGGAEKISEAQRALIASAAILQLQAERVQSSILNGERVNLEQLTRVSNSLMRVLSKLGVKRGQSDPTPSLSEYLAQHHSEDAVA